MPDTRIAKLFRNGASQAVRLPAGFRFPGDQVFATRDEITGDVVLSARPGARTWASFSSSCVPSTFPRTSWPNAP